MVWPFEYSKDKPVEWPSKWPDLKNSKTHRRDDDSHSIFLPSADLLKLQTLMKKLKPTTAVRINGRKWAVSYRYPFPDEAMIQGAKRSDRKPSGQSKSFERPGTGHENWLSWKGRRFRLRENRRNGQRFVLM